VGGRHSKFWNAGNPIFQFCCLKKNINIFSNQSQLQAFQLAAHLGDKTKVFINDGDPLLKPHSNGLFNTIIGWVRPLFPEAYLPQVCVQNRNFCTRNSLLLAKVTECGKRVKVPRPAKCTKNNVIFSNRHILIPRTSKYPKNCQNYEHYVVNYFFNGDFEGLGAICGCAWKKYTLGGILTVDCRIVSS